MAYYKLNCLCVACGTQCEICLEAYPSDCTCPSEDDTYTEEEEND